MTHRVRVAMFLSLVLAGPAGVVAQTTGTLAGEVRDSTGRPLENVEILIQGVARSVLTNAAGAFRFDDAPLGEQQVTARRLGYEAVRRLVTVISGDVTRLDLVLRETPQRLDPVEVTGARFVPTLIGHVHDTFGRPVEHAEILLDGTVLAIRTRANGTFRIDSLEARRYQLTVRLPGYLAAHSLVPMDATRPTEVALRLQGFAQDLGTIEVEADRRGLFGVVATADFKPVVGARVRLHGGGTSQLTDSAGRFAFLRLKPGDYLVAAEAKGLTGQALQVEMVRNGRREVVLTMAPPNPMRRRVPQQRWANHDMGLALAFSSSLNRIGRSELARHAGRQLCDIGRIRLYAGGSEATIIVNGTRALNPWSLCAFNADEIAMVVVGSSSRRGGFGGFCKVNGVTVIPPAGLRCISIWTR